MEKLLDLDYLRSFETAHRSGDDIILLRERREHEVTSHFSKDVKVGLNLTSYLTNISCCITVGDTIKLMTM